ncbi:MAG: DUF6106 family protein [Oscillospiraceae bacterium]|nr:DUF6106 family protein [Oscillospiraceae bacterium]
MDYFYEQLVTVKKSATYTIVKYATFVFAAIALVAIMSLNVTGFITGGIFALFAAACFFLKQKLYVEYEYVITNGSVDIDKIIEAGKRKKVIEFNIKDAELIAMEDSEEAKMFPNKPQKKLDCTTNGNKNKVYVAFLTMGEERCTIRFTPDEKFLDISFRYNPRGVRRQF